MTQKTVEGIPLAWIAERFQRQMAYPYGPTLWSDWAWVELPSPSSQFWPMSAARRR